MSRCTGHCCERFTLYFPPEQIPTLRAEGKIRDIEQIADMLIPLGGTLG